VPVPNPDRQIAGYGFSLAENFSGPAVSSDLSDWADPVSGSERSQFLYSVPVLPSRSAIGLFGVGSLPQDRTKPDPSTISGRFPWREMTSVRIDRFREIRQPNPAPTRTNE
jgi:hypothetical protein